MAVSVSARCADSLSPTRRPVALISLASCALAAPQFLSFETDWRISASAAAAPPRVQGPGANFFAIFSLASHLFVLPAPSRKQVEPFRLGLSFQGLPFAALPPLSLMLP